MSAIGNVIAALLLGGLMGMVGQGARAAIGLKKMNDEAQAQGASWNDVFMASRLVMSLMIGFVAGVGAAIVLGLDKIVKIDIASGGVDLLLGLAAAGYAGTDTIEAFTAKISGRPKTGGADDGAKAGTGGNPAPGPAQNSDLNFNMTNLSATLNSTRAMLADFQNANLTVGSGGGDYSRDMAEARKYLAAINEAASQHGLQPSLICAIGSRESNWGQGSDMHPKGPAGTGDWAPRNAQRWGYAMPPDGLGWGRGLMQVDYAQSDFGQTGPWQDPRENILFGANELAGNIQYFTAHPQGGVDPLRAAVAAYNCGRGGVTGAINSGADVDSRTTGHNYSRDVLARAAWFKAHGFDELQQDA